MPQLHSYVWALILYSCPPMCRLGTRGSQTWPKISPVLDDLADGAQPWEHHIAQILGHYPRDLPGFGLYRLVG